MAKEKLRYEVDPYNRLVVEETGRKLPLSRFRRVLDGKFKTGPNGTLIYHIKAPMYGLDTKSKAPHQVKLRGKWSLNKNHDLVLTLDNWRRQTMGDEITLKGEIVSVSSSSLSFAVTTRSEENLDTRNILKLQGRWQADKHNRLTFRVKKGEGRHDTLTFDGIWEIDKKHRIVYKYEKAQLIRKKTLKETLIFKGSFDITKRNKLSYELSPKGKSVFDFRTGLGFLHEKYIKYEIGIGGSNRRKPFKRTLVLYGKWKIKRNVGLLFEIKYEKPATSATSAIKNWRGRPKVIKFGADARLTKKDEIKFRIKNEMGKNLGLELKLSRKLLRGDGKAFIKLLKDKKEAAIYVGAGLR
ncbi:hypothetical protein KAS42_03330 [bacterium]|nr:hypothetical protein [bacterium]